MPTIRINPEEVISSGSHAETAKQKIASSKNGINAVNWQIDSKIKGRNNIGVRLSSLADKLRDIEAKIGRIKSTVDSNAKTYLWVDEKLEAEAQELYNKMSLSKSPKKKLE